MFAVLHSSNLPVIFIWGGNTIICSEIGNRLGIYIYIYIYISNMGFAVFWMLSIAFSYLSAAEHGCYTFEVNHCWRAPSIGVMACENSVR